MLRATMPASAEETAALLGRVPVFEELADDDLRRVAEVTVPRRFATGEVVFREGDDSDTCYVVSAGHAIGSETQRPIAVVVVGGTISSALLTLIVLPVSYYWAGAARAWLRRRRGVPMPAEMPRATAE